MIYFKEISGCLTKKQTQNPISSIISSASIICPVKSEKDAQFWVGGSISEIRVLMYSVIRGSIFKFISIILCSSILNTVRVGISAPLMLFGIGETPYR